MPEKYKTMMCQEEIRAQVYREQTIAPFVACILDDQYRASVLPQEILDHPIEWSVSGAVKTEYAPSSKTVASADLSRGSVAAALEPAQKPLHAHCLWCGRAFQTAYDRRIGSEVLLYGTPTGILDRGSPLDDAGGRSGPTLGRLPEGGSDERARCLRCIPPVDRPYM
jgi:hypothetical protein